MGKTPRQTSPPVTPCSQKASRLHLPRRYVLRSCSKHGSHSSFRPIRQLSLEQFPEDLRTGAVLQLVHMLSQWVVRVRVIVMTQTRGVTGLRRGGGTSRTCTGLATSVGRDYVTVMVPLHAVRDNVEARHTTAEFFYDSENDSEVITVKGLSLIRHEPQQVAQLTCRACPELGQRFQRSADKTTVKTLALTERVDVDLAKNLEGGVAVLISHPHGFSKRVTVGNFCGHDVLKAGNVVSENVESNLLTSRMLHSLTTATSVSSSSSSLSPVSSSSSSSQPSSSSGPASIQIDNMNVNDKKLPYDNESSVASLILSTSLHDDEMMPASQENQNTLELMNKPMDAAAEMCKAAVSLCTNVCRLLGHLGQHVYNLRKGVPQRLVRIYHNVASCPGSSGGALLLIGRQVWVGLNKTRTSLPVFLHMGEMAGQKQGVAVPLVVNSKSLFSWFS